ncbi:MAG: hypothetical protein ACLPYY_11560 [Acidimicrobiales bacterium]
MRRKRWLFAFVAALAPVLSLGLLAAPAGGVPTPTTTTVTDNAAGLLTGGTLVFTATVAGQPSGIPGGTVAWTGSTCSTSTTTLSALGVATCSITDAQASITYTVTATFTDTDGLYSGSVGTDGPVSPAKAPSTTTVTDNSGLISTGGTLVFTATVGGPGGTPTGSVVWSGSPCNISTTTLIAGVATCSITNAQAGTSYGVTATYGGDTNYNGSIGTDSGAGVGKGTPSTPMITNMPASATYGDRPFTAVVATTGDGNKYVISNSPAACTVGGPDELTVTYVGVGTCSLTAEVAPGTLYGAASGTPQTFVIGRATPSTPTVTNIPTNAVEFAGFTATVGTTGDGTTYVTSTTPGTCTIGPDELTVFFVSQGDCTIVPGVEQGANYFAATGSPQTFTLGSAPRGYWLVGSDGGIFSFGAAAFHGSMGGTWLQRPVVGITPTITRGGYWLVASDGGIFSFGDAAFYGSIPGLGLHPAGSGLPNSLDAPIVGMVPTVTRRGYFMVASDGGVFAFGDARFEGSCPGIGGCAGAAVAVMPDHTGNGYWLVTASGDVYAFGDASFYGTPPPDSVPVVDAVATPDGHGYWLLYANGAVTPFGDAANLGEPVGYVNSFNPASAIFPTADGHGYWVATARGDVFSYGNAPYLGSESDAGLNGLIIAGFGF